MTQKVQRIVAAAGLALLGVAAVPSVASADDWSVKRDPFDATLIARYKTALRKSPHDKGTLAKLTQLYRRYRSVALLVRQLESAHSTHDSDGALATLLGHIALGEKDLPTAKTWYQKASAQRPTDARLHEALGALWAAEGQLDNAAVAQTLALKHSGSTADKQRILQSLAALALQQNDVDAAQKHMEARIALAPKDPRSYLELAETFANAKRYKDAIVWFRRAESRSGADPAGRLDIIARIGATLEQAGEDVAAVNEYRRAIDAMQRDYFLRKELTERIVAIHRERQQLDVLLAYYEKHWSPGKRGFFEWQVLAQLFEELGNSDKSIAAYKKAVAIAPHELDTQRRLIKLLENSGQSDEARKQVETVAKIAPGEPQFHLDLARRYWQAGDKPKALMTAGGVEKRFSGDPGVQATLADLYSEWGQDDKALATYERLARIEPNDSTHLITLGEQYFQRGKKKTALTIWKRIIRNRTDENYAQLGHVYADHDLLIEAEAMLVEAIRLAPNQPKHYRSRASIRERKKQYLSAVEDWERVLDMLPDETSERSARAEARRRIVHLLARSGQRHLQQRLSAWSKQFAATPPAISAGYLVVEAHLRRNETKSARTALERLRSLQPSDVEATRLLIKVYRAEREYEKAIELLEQLARESKGGEREFFEQIAEVKTILHQDDEAIRYVRKALQTAPKDPAAHRKLAERYLAMQRYDEAIEAYEKTIELDPRAFNDYFALAKLHIHKNDLDKAASLYRSILKKASDEETLYLAGQEAVEIEEVTHSLAELERAIAPMAATFAHKPIFRRTLVEIYARYVPQLVEGSQQGDKKAADELTRLGARALKPLLEALADTQDPNQQRIAVSLLGDLGNPAAAAPLVKLASQSPNPNQPVRGGALLPDLNWETRVQALVSAGRLGEPRVLPDFVRLAQHQDIALREASVFALGVLGDPGANKALAQALNDSSDSVQVIACLGFINKKTIEVSALIDVISDRTRHDGARASCAYALGHRQSKTATPALLALLEHGNDNSQRVAAWALGQIGDKGTLPRLLTAYFAKRGPIRTAAGWALGQVVEARRVSAAPYRHRFPTRAGRFDATTVVNGLASGLSVAPLTPAITVGNEKSIAQGLAEILTKHRDLVAQTLMDLNSRATGLGLGPLTEGVDTLPRDQRQSVHDSLRAISEPLQAQFARLASHRDPDVRGLSLHLLGKTGDATAAVNIAAGFVDDSPGVREAAAFAATAFCNRDPASGAPLANLLIDGSKATSWQQRIVATQALGRLSRPSPGAVRALAFVATHDQKTLVRHEAVVALSKHGTSAEAIDALATLAARPGEPIGLQLEAIRALQNIHSASATAALGQLAHTAPQAEIRAAAARTIAPRRRRSSPPRIPNGENAP